MKKRSKISPGQLSIFDQIIYNNQTFSKLKDAMICAMQDFYIKKIYPSKIITTNNIYNLKDMKKFWEMHGLLDSYIY